MVVASSQLNAQETPLLRISLALQGAGSSSSSTQVETAILEMQRPQLDRTISLLESCLEGRSTGNTSEATKNSTIETFGELQTTNDWCCRATSWREVSFWRHIFMDTSTRNPQISFQYVWKVRTIYLCWTAGYNSRELSIQVSYIKLYSLNFDNIRFILRHFFHTEWLVQVLHILGRSIVILTNKLYSIQLY